MLAHAKNGYHPVKLTLSVNLNHPQPEIEQNDFKLRMAINGYFKRCSPRGLAWKK